MNMKDTIKDIKKPSLWSFSLNGGQRQLTMNYNIVETKDEENTTWYEYDTITLPLGVYGYGSIVSAIITSKYSNDEMQAIINNYLIDKKNHKTEFDEMQNYRTFAKETARRITEEIADIVKG